MTPEAQRIAIAKACGWTKIEWYDGDNSGPGYWHGIPYLTEEEVFKTPEPKLNQLRKYGTQLPDYLNDLNAMHEATKEFDLKQTERFSNALKAVIEDRYCIRSAIDARYLTVNATASDRAEAFLRMNGKWIEDEPTSASPRETGRR